MGTIRESGEPTVLVARLGVEGRRVAEIETLVIRHAEVAARLDEIGMPRQAWSEPVGERLPRAEHGMGSGWSTSEESLWSEPRG